MEKGEIDHYLLSQEIFALFCRQLNKDFEGAGIGPETLNGLSGPDSVRPVLRNAVRILERRHDALPRLLYRVDVSEKQLRSYTAKMPNAEFTEVVAELIMMRTLQKVILRKRFSNE